MRRNDNNLLSLQRYFLRLTNIEFNNITYCKYYELYTFAYVGNLVDQQSLPPNTYLEKKQEGCQQCIVKQYKQNHMHITRMNIIRPCVGKKYYLRMLLNYRAARSFTDLLIVNGILYSNFQDAARAFGLLENTNENEQCFAEAMDNKCTPAQLRLLFCRLILEGMAAQFFWQNYRELLSADYISKKGNVQQGEDEALEWIAGFLEEHGC